MEFVVVVDGFVDAASAIGVFDGHVHNKGGGCPASLKGGQVGQRLDGRSGLTGSQGDVHLAVDGFVVEVLAADHSQDLACFDVEHHDRAIGDVLGL